MHGYGKKVFPNGTIQEGLYQESDYDVKSRTNITKYNSNAYFAKQIDWEHYIINQISNNES